MLPKLISIVMKDDRATNFYNLDQLFGEPGSLCFPRSRDIAVERLQLLGRRTTVRPTPLRTTRLLRRKNTNSASASVPHHFLPAAAGLIFPPVPFNVVVEGSEEIEL